VIDEQSQSKIIEWAQDSLLSHGCTINTPPENIQANPWSITKRFLTSNGYIYLKQTAPALSLEPFIIKILYDQFHANVPVVIDINQELNCFLMKDSGNSLIEFLKQDFRPDILCLAINLYTDIQYAAVKHADTFLELGVPDWRLDKFPSLYMQLINQKDLLIDDGMTINELNQLHELYPVVSATCGLLSSFNIPETLDHCDFHSNNILIDNVTIEMTIIDWGETVITHPFFSLICNLNSATRHFSLKETDDIYLELQDACFKNWLDYENMQNLRAAMLIAKKLWPIYAALGFHRLMMSCNAGEFKSYYANRPSRLTGYLKEYIKRSNTIS